jgi:predicted HicB family RNase H-like nuclease
MRLSKTEVRLTPELKDKLTAAAENRDMSVSDLLRSLIVELSETPPQKFTLAVETEIQRFTLRLPKILVNAAKIKANKKGMTLTKWIESLIKVAITKSSVLSDAEFSELKASNREISRVGRNLNQITRAINAMLQFSIEKKMLEELNEKIDDNSNAIFSFMKASRNTWGDE